MNRKVITEPKGIYTNPPKRGKFSDAYFSNLMISYNIFNFS